MTVAKIPLNIKEYGLADFCSKVLKHESVNEAIQPDHALKYFKCRIAKRNITIPSEHITHFALFTVLFTRKFVCGIFSTFICCINWFRIFPSKTVSVSLTLSLSFCPDVSSKCASEICKNLLFLCSFL